MPTIRPIRPSAALQVRYQTELEAAVDQMAHEVGQAVRGAYAANPSRLGMLFGLDASPAAVLTAAIRKQGRRWLRRFDDLSTRMAQYYTTAVQDRVDSSFRDDLRRGGFTVRFKMSAEMRDAFAAAKAEQVGLIRSIASQYLSQVEQAVMQSVSTGRDLGGLAQTLEKRHGVTRRRAAFIARDQNNKATATMQRARQLSLGITKAKWLHSAGGHEPRPEHVAFSGKVYDVREGHDFDNGEGIVWPGTAINCKCVSVPVVPGFDD